MWSRAVCPPSLAWAFEDLCSGIPLFCGSFCIMLRYFPSQGVRRHSRKAGLLLAAQTSLSCASHSSSFCSLGEDDLVCSGFVLGLVHEVGYSRDLSDPTVRILPCLRSSPSSLVSQRSWSGTVMTRGGS